VGVANLARLWDLIRTALPYRLEGQRLQGGLSQQRSLSGSVYVPQPSIASPPRPSTATSTVARVADYQREFPHLASCIAPNRIGSTEWNASRGTMARKR
jgi:hypothetical protein